MQKHSFRRTMLLFIGITIFVALPLYGQMPTPWKNTNEPKTPAQKPEEETKTPQHDTKDSSSFRVLPATGPTGQVRHNDANSKNSHTSSEQWMIYLTFALAAVGFFQLITFIFQTIVIYGQWKMGRKAASVNFCKAFSNIRAYLYTGHWNGRQSPFEVVPYLIAPHEMAAEDFRLSVKHRSTKRAFEEACDDYHEECKKYLKVFTSDPKYWENEGQKELIKKLDSLLDIARKN